MNMLSFAIFNGPRPAKLTAPPPETGAAFP